MAVQVGTFPSKSYGKSISIMRSSNMLQGPPEDGGRTQGFLGMQHDGLNGRMLHGRLCFSFPMCGTMTQLPGMKRVPFARHRPETTSCTAEVRRKVKDRFLIESVSSRGDWSIVGLSHFLDVKNNFWPFCIKLDVRAKKGNSDRNCRWYGFQGLQDWSRNRIKS